MAVMIVRVRPTAVATVKSSATAVSQKILLFSGCKLKRDLKEFIAHCRELCINAALGASLYCWC